ncbi:MAG: hypothetical protein RLZ54_794, partial [Candidatus Parcubacteria bacterium]
NRELRITNVETRYIDESGKPLSGEEYLKSLLGKLPALYQSEDQLRTMRADPETREALLKELGEIGIDDDQFVTLQRMFDAPDSDIFDILAHLSYGEEIKTRSERVQRVWNHGHVITDIGNIKAKEFLEYVLQYYHKRGSIELVRSKIGEVIQLYNHGNVLDMTNAFGGYEGLLEAWKEVQKELFEI